MIQANHCPSPRPCIPTHYVIRSCSSAAYQVTPDRAVFQVMPHHTIAPYPVTPDYSSRVPCDAWLGLALPQSIIDHQYCGTFGVPPSYSPRKLLIGYGKVHLLICERKSVQLTSLPHSRSYDWPLFTALESLATFVINPRWSFQLQWDLHPYSYHGPTAHHPRATTILVETTTSY
jgi:hypothetical protein